MMILSAAKEKEKKQLLLKATLEAKKKANEQKRKEQEDADFIPSNFASGPRKRVGVAISRQNSIVPTVNPCLVKAPNPCLVKAPNPCLVKDSSSDSKRATSTPTESSKTKGTGNEKKHENKHKDKERHKHKHKDREKPPHDSHTSKLSAGPPGKTPGLGVKTDAKGGTVKKIPKKHKIKKPPGKPPLSFEQLLQIAQKKHNLPVEMPPEKMKPVEEQRPMTQEEKEQYQRRHSKQYQAWLKFGKKPPAGKPGETTNGRKSKPPEEVQSNNKHMAQLSLKKHSSDSNRLPGTSKTVTDTRTLGKSRPSSEMPVQSTQSKALGKSKSSVGAGSGHSMSTSKQPGTLEKNKPYKLSAGVCDPKVRLKTENNVRKVSTSLPTNFLQCGAKPCVNGFNDSSRQTSKTLLKPIAGAMRRPTHAPPGVNGSKQSSGYIATRETVLKCGSPAKVVKASSVAERAKPVTPWDRIYGEIQKNNPKPGEQIHIWLSLRNTVQKCDMKGKHSDCVFLDNFCTVKNKNVNI